MGDENCDMVFQDVWPEMLDCFVDCISLLVDLRVIQFSSLQPSTHEGYRPFIIVDVFLCEDSCK